MNACPPKILVVGALNMDLITTTEKIPGPGETVIGCDFSTAPGGKGANQACQAAKLGAQVTMVGKVGADAFGDELIRSLKAVGVDTSNVIRDASTYTAVADIQLLKENGRTLNNRIVVAPGGNYCLNSADVAFLEAEIENYDMVMLQMEVPSEINELITEWAHIKGVPVMLNPAPSGPISQKMLSKITYISPNEYEAADLTGVNLHHTNGQLALERLDDAVEQLHQMGVSNVLITLGEQGSIISTPQETLTVACVPGIKAVDPTAAGDSFMGAFCTAVASGVELSDALTFASHTAAVTVSGLGAQPSLPTLACVISQMEARGCDQALTEELLRRLGQAT